MSEYSRIASGASGRIAGMGFIALALAIAACDSPTEPPVDDDPVFAQVTAGTDHVCALDDGGTAYCWGENERGQLGNGGTQASQSPVEVAGDLTFERIDAGELHTCGITTDARAYCWGANDVGQLGTGDAGDSHEPAAVAGDLAFESVVAGYRHSCAVTTDAVAYCWGRNTEGQTGAPTADQCMPQNGGSVPCNATPTAVVGDLAIDEIRLGLSHSCALTTSGAAYCWGWNVFAQLGDGTTETRQTPAPVAGGHSYTYLALGAVTGCGITSGGAAYCWGTDHYGSLGFGGTGGRQPEPAQIVGGHSFDGIWLVESNSTLQHACGLTADDSTYCWGINDSGQLGTSGGLEQCTLHNGESAPCTGTPVAALTGHDFVSLSLAQGFGCGLTEAGEIWCWGSNQSGQYGTGSISAGGPDAVRVPFPWEDGAESMAGR